MWRITSQLCLKSSHGFSTHSERNINLHKGWRPLLIWASVASVFIPHTTTPHPSIPSSGSFLYLEHVKAAASGPLQWLFHLPIRILLQMSLWPTASLLFSLCSSASSSVRPWAFYTYLPPSCPPLSCYLLICFPQALITIWHIHFIYFFCLPQ